MIKCQVRLLVELDEFLPFRYRLLPEVMYLQPGLYLGANLNDALVLHALNSG